MTTDLDHYYSNLEIRIREILSRPELTTTTYDILDLGLDDEEFKLQILKRKHYQMRIGEIWQEAIGSFTGFVNLKVGHETGLDIISESRKIAIELKNRTNTDNSSSKKANLDKLAKFKTANPDYTVIYANINDSTEIKTLSGRIVPIIHSDVEIQHMVGMKFIQFIFGDESDNVIQFIKKVALEHILNK